MEKGKKRALERAIVHIEIGGGFNYFITKEGGVSVAAVSAEAGSKTEAGHMS